jgi:hypothetical protein
MLPIMGVHPRRQSDPLDSTVRPISPIC